MIGPEDLPYANREQELNRYKSKIKLKQLETAHNPASPHLKPYKKLQIYNFINIQMVSPKTYALSVFLCLATLALVQAKLEVSNFAQMDHSLNDPQLTDIAYSIANFGFAPFGKTLVAQLQQSPGLNLECTSNASYAPHESIQNSFLLIPRGECPFVTKAIHAQELGAKMAIIMDNEDHQRNIIMKDNGYGYKVTIPCIFINYKLGQKLKALLNQTKVIMRISFQNIKSQKADLVLYLQSFNRQTYYFLQQFRPFHSKIRQHITLHLVYDVINCTMCSSEDCYYNGQYCTVSYDHLYSANGQMLLDQQIREQIMYEKHPDEWWSYMECIGSQCARISELKECNAKCLNKGEFGTKPDVLANQLAQSFDYNKDNAILRQNLEALKNSGVQAYPSLTINGVKIKGSLNAEFVFDDICNTLLKPPKECSNYITEQEFHVNFSNTYWITIILVLLLCAVLFVGLFIFCRRRMRKKMTTEMQGRVDDMVSKYIEFYSERNNRK